MSSVKEQILAEIERLEGENNCGTSDFIEAKRIAYKQVKKALDTLPEHPDKYNRALKKAGEWMSSMNQGGCTILIDIFPELGEHLDPRYGLPELPVKELEKEYARFIRTDHHQYQDLIGNGGIDFARHFAEWGAKYLKK